MKVWPPSIPVLIALLMVFFPMGCRETASYKMYRDFSGKVDKIKPLTCDNALYSAQNCRKFLGKDGVYRKGIRLQIVNRTDHYAVLGRINTRFPNAASADIPLEVVETSLIEHGDLKREYAGFNEIAGDIQKALYHFNMVRAYGCIAKTNEGGPAHAFNISLFYSETEKILYLQNADRDSHLFGLDISELDIVSLKRTP